MDSPYANTEENKPLRSPYDPHDPQPNLNPTIDPFGPSMSGAAPMVTVEASTGGSPTDKNTNDETHQTNLTVQLPFDEQPSAPESASLQNIECISVGLFSIPVAAFCMLFFYVAVFGNTSTTAVENLKSIIQWLNSVSKWVSCIAFGAVAAFGAMSGYYELAYEGRSHRTNLERCHYVLERAGATFLISGFSIPFTWGLRWFVNWRTRNE